MKTIPDLNILCLQTDIVWNEPEKNRDLLEIKIMSHLDDHDLVLIPETFTTGFPKFPKFTSEKMGGETFNWMADMARKTKAVIAGSFILEEKGINTNTMIWMRPDGTYKLYDKRHVFSMANENEVITKGNKQVIVELKGWKIKPMICYDLRFPVWSKNRLIEDNTFDYDIAIYIANWPAIRSYQWSQLLIARAIENLAYIIGVNRVGRDPYGIYYSGDSMVIDPTGMIISQAAEGKERILSENLSYNKLKLFREKFNVGADWDEFNLNII